MKIAPVKKWENNKKFNLWVIGNIAKVTSSTSENISEDLDEILQSTQGFSVGISPIRTFFLNSENLDESDLFRIYATANYKINGFQDVGASKETVNLSQFRATLGVEFEGLFVTNGGPFNIGFEAVQSFFDKTKYGQVFGEEKDNIFSIESTFIIPLTGNFGFMVSGVFSPGSKPIYQAGMIISVPKK